MTKKLKKKGIKLIIGLSAFLIIALFFGIAEKVSITVNEYVKIAVYLSLYILVAYEVIIKAIKGILSKQLLDENFLMTIASIGAIALKDYKEAIAVMIFYGVGEWFQSYAVGKSRKSIASLMDIRPDVANILKDGKEETVLPDEIKVGDILVIKAGEKVPVDCEVISGESYFDTSCLTGESKPVKFSNGDGILSGIICLDGVITARAQKVYAESTVEKIMELVEYASTKKARAENFITKFAKVYTPIVVVLAVMLAVIPPIISGNFPKWISRALTFLVVSCPCALVISVPLSFFGGIGNASRYGVLIKGGSYMEKLDKAKVFVFDKTGTLTSGKLAVTSVKAKQGEEKLLKSAYICEKSSNHPIAKAIRNYRAFEVDSGYKITEISGKGIIAEKDGEIILCGNKKLMEERGVSYETTNDVGSVVYVASSGEYLGSITVADEIKKEAKEFIAELTRKGCETLMLTGDNEIVAKSISKELGLTGYKAELLPQQKVEELERIMNKNGKGEVVYVGDGINDAPVLMRADVGIAMGGIGSDSAVEASDIVLMYDKLRSILTAKKISRKTMACVRENIIFAIGVKVGVLITGAIGLTGIWIAVFADVGVAVIAILNAMRAGIKIKGE